MRGTICCAAGPHWSSCGGRPRPPPSTPRCLPTPARVVSWQAQAPPPRPDQLRGKRGSGRERPGEREGVESSAASAGAASARGARGRRRALISAAPPAEPSRSSTSHSRRSMRSRAAGGSRTCRARPGVTKDNARCSGPGCARPAAAAFAVPGRTSWTRTSLFGRRAQRAAATVVSRPYARTPSHEQAHATVWVRVRGSGRPLHPCTTCSFHDKPNNLNMKAVEQCGSKAYVRGPHAWLGCERKAWSLYAKDVNACARRGPGHAPFRESSRREPQVTPTLCLHSHAQVGTSLHGRDSGCRQRRPAHARAAGGGRRAALWAGTSGGNFRQVRQLTILRQVVIGSSE